jgi:hypothetical protein
LNKIAFILALLFCAIGAMAEDIYVAQASAGADSGADAANAHSVTWLNTAANWGAGAGKVSAGDTVHLCGTFTTTAVFQAAGTAGNVITFLFESGAKFSKAHWNQSGVNGNAAIYANGLSYIVVDGGSNGLIECTANGTALANQLDCHGVRLDGNMTESSVKNLTVTNLYVRTASSADANYICNGIYFYHGVFTDCTILTNHTSQSGSGIQVTWDHGTTNLLVQGNVCTKSGIEFNMGPSGANATNFNTRVVGNDFSGDLSWSGESTIHMNTLHIFSTSTGNQMTGLEVNGNYFHGNMGTFPTSLAFFEGYISSPLICNNLFFHDTFSGGNGDLTLKGADGARVHNNTFANNTSGGNTAIGATEWTGFDKFSATNNVILDYNYAIFDSTVEGGGTALTAADYNLIYPTTQLFRFNNVSGQSYATWTAAGFNAHGVTTNPSLDSGYAPPVGSSAVDSGANLSTLFTTDKAGVSRGALWDIGAYEYAAGGGGGGGAVTLTRTSGGVRANGGVRTQ